MAELVMNVFAPKNAKEFPNWEFRGKPFVKFNKTWIRAKSKTYYYTWYYCFEENIIYDDIYEQLPIKNYENKY